MISFTFDGRARNSKGREFKLEAALQAALGEEPKAQRGRTTRSDVRARLRTAAGIGVSAASSRDRFEEWSYYYGEDHLSNMTDPRRELLQLRVDQQGVVRAYNRSGEHRQVFALAERRHPCGVTMVRPVVWVLTASRAGTRGTPWTVVSF